jgi:hypothetical protein
MSQPVGSVCCNNEVEILELIDLNGDYAGDLFKCVECNQYSQDCRN